MKNKNNLNSFRLFCNAVNKLIGTNLEPLHTEFMNYILKNQLPNSYPNQFISIKKACEITKLKEDTIKRSDYFQLFMCNFKEMEFFFVKKLKSKNGCPFTKNRFQKNTYGILGGQAQKLLLTYFPIMYYGQLLTYKLVL